jgi:hypothetical protein
VAPAHDLLHHGLRDELLPKEKSEDFALEELGQQAVLELSEMMKRPLKVLAALGRQEVDMGNKKMPVVIFWVK